MTKDELMSLVKAGFTKDEILKLSATKEFTAETKPEEKSTEVSEEAEKVKEVKKVEDSPSVSEEAFSKLNNAIDDFTKKLNSFNITNAEMEQENKQEDLGDILARVLLPNGEEIK